MPKPNSFSRLSIRLRLLKLVDRFLIFGAAPMFLLSFFLPIIAAERTAMGVVIMFLLFSRWVLNKAADDSLDDGIIQASQLNNKRGLFYKLGKRNRSHKRKP